MSEQTDAPHTYVVMLYIYKGVHNWDQENKEITRELACAVPVYVTQNREIADMFAEEETDPDYIYEVVEVPPSFETILKLVTDFEKRRELKDARVKG